MRKNPSEAERVMWEKLRKFPKSGFPFRRQHPLDFYITDFYCHTIRLVVEVDGAIHKEKECQIHDEGRTGELERSGITVQRFTNNQILQDSDMVVARIKATLRELTSLSA